MDKVKKYVINLFDDHRSKSYFFDYDVFVSTDAKTAAKIIVDALERNGYDYTIMNRETEKTRKPVYRIETYNGKAYYRFYSLGLSENSTRVFATRIDPWWMYLLLPLSLFLSFFVILYAFLFTNMSYFENGLVFLGAALFAWASIYLSEKYLISDIIDIFHEINEKYAEINKKENKKLVL